MSKFRNQLYINDNINVLNGLNSNSVDLIYLDPPFNSKRFYNAAIGSVASGSSFKDTWSWKDVDEYKLDLIANDYPELADFIEIIGRICDMSMKAYITYMSERVIQLHRILKDTGSIYYHCGPIAGHFVKLMLDCIFGKKNFQNEIIWQYFAGGKSKIRYARKHDNIYFFSKNDNFYYQKFKIKRYLDFKPSLTDESEKAENGKDEFGYYSMISCPDVWQIKSVFNLSKEHTGYPTQKPIALLDRIIKASCPEDGVVLDPFLVVQQLAFQQIILEDIGLELILKIKQ